MNFRELEESIMADTSDKRDIYKRRAAKIFDIPYEEVTEQQRRIARIIGFGILYGMSNYSLGSVIKDQQMLEMPKPEWYKGHKMKIKDKWKDQMDFEMLRKQLKILMCYIDDNDYCAQFCGKDLYEVDVYAENEKEFIEKIMQTYHDKVREYYVYERCYLDYYTGTTIIVCRKYKEV